MQEMHQADRGKSQCLWRSKDLRHSARVFYLDKDDLYRSAEQYLAENLDTFKAKYPGKYLIIHGEYGGPMVGRDFDEALTYFKLAYYGGMTPPDGFTVVGVRL